MKQKKSLPLMFTLAVMLAFMITSCKKSEDLTTTQATKIEDMVVSPSFKFATTKPVSIKIFTLDNANNPVPNIRVNIYNDFPDNGGSVMISGMSDASGLFTTEYKIPSGVDSLVIGTTAIGFCNMQKVRVSSGNLNFTLGGKNEPMKFKSGGESYFKTTQANFYPIGTWNSSGVPNYLATPNDVIDASMLADINATLPEYMPAPTNHPQYFNDANDQNLILTEACNVWVTFVSEGAGYQNVLGYYTYQTGNRPTSTSQIDSIHVIFPNVSFSGSGGGLHSGNKVYIGQHAPGTEIGWVLIANGYQNNSVTPGLSVYYSDKALNPESAATKKQHTILLNDIGRGKFLLSFEDLRRDAGADNDFNDAVFYVTADPIQSVNTQHVPLPSYTSTDTDKDGVPDNFDDYPNDATKAFDNFYPSKDNFGSFAFEDLWPGKGDYDFNDMVVDYNFNQITNGQNQVVQILLTAKLTAMGASYKNGFGIQLPIAPNLISSVTGTNIKESYIVQNSNGTEAGQSKATIIVFDNGFNLLPFPGAPSVGVNTTPNAKYVTPQTLNIAINLTTPVPLATMGLPPYNPFMIINQDRGREVHLIDNHPTDLANLSLLGTDNDDSKPAQGRYYVTKNNLPWAIDITSHFDYPNEKVEISEAYLKFIQWAESNGQQYFDWYKDKAGYRNSNNIYKHN